MAKNSERLSLSIITPKGVAIYPKLNTPDTKFVPEGVYETKLKFSPDAEDAVLAKKLVPWSEIVAAVAAQQEEFLQQQKKKLLAGDGKAKAKAKTLTSLPFGEEADLDDEGEETGLIVVKAKMKASGTGKDGKPWTRKPILFDAKNKRLGDDSPAIWGGSTLKVAASAVPYYNAKDNVVGTTLYLEAVQVIDLVSGQGRTAEAYGFGEEDGYAAEESEDAPFAADGGGEDDSNF